MACGKDANQFDRVWFKEAVELPDITFDYDTYLLMAKKAKALKEPGAEPPTIKPPTPAKLGQDAQATPSSTGISSVERSPGQPPSQLPTSTQPPVVCNRPAEPSSAEG